MELTSRVENQQGDVSLMKVPPQNIEAERFILGGILLDNEAFYQVVEILGTDDFYREAHRKIFRGMTDLFEKNEPVDLITITNYFQGKNNMEAVGGASYLASLVDEVSTTANISSHAKIVKEKAVLRKLINVSTTIANKGYEQDRNVEDFLDSAEKMIFEVTESKIRPTFYSMREIVKHSFKTVERLYERKEMVTGVPTGFTDFDRLTSGLQNSDLIILAGRPSMGKTALALNVAQYASIEANIPVAVFSLEMAREQLVMRMLCSEARVDASKLRGGMLSEKDWPRLVTAAGNLSETLIFIDDTPGLTALEMRAKSRRLKAEKNLGLIIVDYLQLMRGRDRSESREQEISDISRSLKGLAKELNVPVLAISQLNRGVEGRSDKRPQLADLRESGAIEQDADVIAFVYRDEIYNRDNPDNKGVAELIIGKQRNGPVGVVKLTFLDKFTAFENRAYDQDEDLSPPF